MPTCKVYVVGKEEMSTLRLAGFVKRRSALRGKRKAIKNKTSLLSMNQIPNLTCTFTIKQASVCARRKIKVHYKKICKHLLQHGIYDT